MFVRRENIQKLWLRPQHSKFSDPHSANEVRVSRVLAQRLVPLLDGDGAQQVCAFGVGAFEPVEGAVVVAESGPCEGEVGGGDVFGGIAGFELAHDAKSFVAMAGFGGGVGIESGKL